MRCTPLEPRDDPDDDLLSELPALDDDGEQEAPFDPDDDSDLALFSNEDERLGDQDLAEGSDDVVDAEIQDPEGEESLSEGDMAPVDDLIGADSELLAGSEDGWTDGTEEDGARIEGLDDEVGLGALDGDVAGDDGEEGLADDDALEDLAATLPPLDRSRHEAEDDEEGELGAGHGSPAGVSASECSVRANDPGAERIEVWPGVRWAVVSPRSWETTGVVQRRHTAGSVYGRAGDGLYAWADGVLVRYGFGGAQTCLARDLGHEVVSLAADDNAVWVATTQAVCRSSDGGQTFERMCGLPPGSGLPNLDHVGRGAVWMQRAEQLRRFSPGARRFMPASPVQAVVMWATDGAGAMALSQPSGPLLRSIDGGFRWTELPLAVDGASGLWVCGDVVVVATAQGLLASRGRDWLQLMPPSATVCAVVGEPTVPRLYACVAYPEGWVLARRPCNDASWRPRVITRLDPALGAPVFLSAHHRDGRTTLHLVTESGLLTLVVKDA